MLALNLHLKLRSIFVYKLSHFWFNRSSVFLWQFLWKSHIFKNFPPSKPWTQISKQLRKIQGINIVLAKNFPHFGMEILVFHSAKSFWGSVVGFIFFSNFFCYLQNESEFRKVFLLNKHKAMGFIWFGQACMSFNLLRTLNFFYENYWSRLTSSSKCGGSASHGNIKFRLFGNTNTGRHCLLLQFHLIY